MLPNVQRPYLVPFKYQQFNAEERPFDRQKLGRVFILAEEHL
jgi:hypothetical protein